MSTNLQTFCLFRGKNRLQQAQPSCTNRQCRSPAHILEKHLYFWKVPIVLVLNSSVVSFYTLVSMHYWFFVPVQNMHRFPIKLIVAFDFSSCNASICIIFHKGERFLTLQDISLNCPANVPGQMFTILPYRGSQLCQVHRDFRIQRIGTILDDDIKKYYINVSTFERSCCIMQRGRAGTYTRYETLVTSAKSNLKVVCIKLCPRISFQTSANVGSEPFLMHGKWVAKCNVLQFLLTLTNAAQHLRAH